MLGSINNIDDVIYRMADDLYLAEGARPNMKDPTDIWIFTDRDNNPDPDAINDDVASRYVVTGNTIQVYKQNDFDGQDQIAEIPFHGKDLTTIFTLAETIAKKQLEGDREYEAKHAVPLIEDSMASYADY